MPQLVRSFTVDAAKANGFRTCLNAMAGVSFELNGTMLTVTIYEPFGEDRAVQVAAIISNIDETAIEL